VIRSCLFALDPTGAQVEAFRSHCGAQRVAYNWALAHVRANWAQRAAEQTYGLTSVVAAGALQRRDLLHKLTTRLVAGFDVIGIEDLVVANMLRNRRLARHIAGASWAELRRQLEYKSAPVGVRLVVVNRWAPSSKTCSGCGAVRTKLALSERTSECTACGLVLDRDHNAACNLAALAAADTGESRRELLDGSDV
jgi:IS605 OrfB family transposase